MKYTQFIEAVQDGNRFRINLVKKEIYLNGLKVKIEVGSNGTYEEVEELFDYYKHSAPTEKKLGSKPYFKALSYEEIEDDDLAFGLNRNVAQAMLESYLIFHPLVWQDNSKWFWKGSDRELIILKEWI